MIDTIDELKKLKKVYVFNKSVYGDKSINYVQYSITKVEYRGFNKWYIQLKHNAVKSKFPKVYNIVGNVLMDGRFEFHETLDDLIKSYCRIIKYKPDKNSIMFEKLKEEYPHNFI